MKVTLERHGGFAAGVYQRPRVVESATLVAQQQEELSKLVADLQAAPFDQQEGPGEMRDAMTFAITIEDNGMTKVFRQADLQMSDAFAGLLTWIEQRSSEVNGDPK